MNHSRERVREQSLGHNQPHQVRNGGSSWEEVRVTCPVKFGSPWHAICWLKQFSLALPHPRSLWPLSLLKGSHDFLTLTLTWSLSHHRWLICDVGSTRVSLNPHCFWPDVNCDGERMKGARKALSLPTPTTSTNTASQSPDFACTSNSVCQKLAGQLCPLIYQGTWPWKELFSPTAPKNISFFLSSHS